MREPTIRQPSDHSPSDVVSGDHLNHGHKKVHDGHLTAAYRNSLAADEFAGPARSYPIPDVSHARNALARVSQFGSPEVKARVRAKVRAKFPGIQQEQ